MVLFVMNLLHPVVERMFGDFSLRILFGMMGCDSDIIQERI